jgi:hypothetical protein
LSSSELLTQEKTRLELLERERVRRMKGEDTLEDEEMEQSKRGKKRPVSGDGLDENFVLDDDMGEPGDEDEDEDEDDEEEGEEEGEDEDEEGDEDDDDEEGDDDEAE